MDMQAPKTLDYRHHLTVAASNVHNCNGSPKTHIRFSYLFTSLQHSWKPNKKI